MPLYKESGSVKCLVVVKQEVKVINAKDRLFPRRDIELEVYSQGIINVLNIY
jgi:hypothetical protein